MILLKILCILIGFTLGSALGNIFINNKLFIFLLKTITSLILFPIYLFTYLITLLCWIYIIPIKILEILLNAYKKVKLCLK